MKPMKPAKRPKARPVTGYVLFEGPSALDGSPIVVIATGIRASKNAKTGAMIQTLGEALAVARSAELRALL